VVQKTTEKASKAKKMDMKHARWPENRLLDAIAECFSAHNYWPIKALRERIPQPEAFIREGLDKIAVLNRTGRFANCWSLKPAYRTMIAQDNQALPANDTVAPQPSANIPSDDEDEDDLKMEDVL
jgi:transcription initiation factor TFIIF subunit beta